MTTQNATVTPLSCGPGGVTSSANDSGCEPAAGSGPVLGFERLVSIIVPIIFGMIAVLGFAGNLLVIIVVVGNRQMRNSTNLLIISLALADLFFIVICVPFTATMYAMPIWPFGDAWCKIYQYMINVTAYASVYTLVLMSLDRYLAVVHPISTMGLRNERNTYIAIIITWAMIFVFNIPILMQYQKIDYEFMGEMRSACMNMRIYDNPKQGRLLYGCFFAFGYVIPLTLVTILYGAMIKRLLYGVVPRGNQSSESMRSKRRVTRMVVIVVLIFAICWLPIQVIFMLTNFGSYPESTSFVVVQIASNCLAYMNSCVNPILYAFLSENFRKSFRKVLCMDKLQPVRLDFERTNAKALDPLTRTSAINNNENCV